MRQRGEQRCDTVRGSGGKMTEGRGSLEINGGSFEE